VNDEPSGVQHSANSRQSANQSADQMAALNSQRNQHYVVKCDIGPRRNQVSGPFTNADLMANTSANQGNGANTSMNFGPMRGQNKMQKEPINNMYKQPRSMTPDDNVTLPSDSNFDYPTRNNQNGPGQHRNSQSVSVQGGTGFEQQQLRLLEESKHEGDDEQMFANDGSGAAQNDL